MPRRSSPALAVWLDCLFGAESAGYVELRHKLRAASAGMGREFFDIRDPRLADTIRARGGNTDVFVGVAPRSRRDGTRTGIDRVHALWVDADGAAALDALRAFEPSPAIVVASGSPDSAHAYWPMWPPVTPDEAEHGNRRLAAHLAADGSATDAARILRPPDTWNFKHSPPAPVTISHLEIATYTLDEVAGELADPQEAKKQPQSRALPIATDDPLIAISPRVYVEALTGREIGRDGKIACPFHDDRTPSLHVYDQADQGWTCFGCGRGGTIIDFGAALYEIEPRGSGYHRIRRQLEQHLLTNLTRGAA